MKNPRISADKVEKEIERLKQSEHVKLAMKEKRGKELEAAGVTMDNIQAFVEAAEDD